MLRIIIGKPDLKLTKEETQYDLQHLFGERSICLDVFGVDDENFADVSSQLMEERDEIIARILEKAEDHPEE